MPDKMGSVVVIGHFYRISSIGLQIGSIHICEYVVIIPTQSPKHDLSKKVRVYGINNEKSMFLAQVHPTPLAIYSQ